MNNFVVVCKAKFLRNEIKKQVLSKPEKKNTEINKNKEDIRMSNEELKKIKEEDKKNIIKGLSLLLELYADTLKEATGDTKSDGVVMDCQLFSIEESVKKINSIKHTMDLFTEESVEVFNGQV